MGGGWLFPDSLNSVIRNTCKDTGLGLLHGIPQKKVNYKAICEGCVLEGLMPGRV